MRNMEHPSSVRRRPNHAWCRRIFAARTVERGGVVRRAVQDMEREIGRNLLEAEVRRRGFHVVECDGQFIIICNSGHMGVIC